MKKISNLVVGFILSFLFSSLFSITFLPSLASANLIVDPAKLGILRLQLYPLSPAVAIREFRIGNTYDVPMQIELEAVEDMEKLIALSETNFTLQPNENRTIEYTVMINEPGYYSGGILIKASIGRGSFGYKADLAVFVNKSNMQPYFVAIVAIVAVVVGIVFVFFLVFRRRGSRGGVKGSKRGVKGKRHEI